MSDVTVALSLQTAEAMDAVVSALWAPQEAAWKEAGQPEEHLFLEVRRVNLWLREAMAH